MLDAVFRSHQGDVVHQFVGHGGDGFGLFAVQIQILNFRRRLAITQAHHQFIVKIAVLGAHAAHVKRQILFHFQAPGFQIVGDVQFHGIHDFKTIRPSGDGLRIDRLALRRIIQGEPAVADFRRHGDVFRPFRTQKDRNIGAQGMGNRLQRLAQAPGAGGIRRIGNGVMGAGAPHRVFACQHLADDVDIFPGPRQWLGKGLAIPAFHHLGPGHAQPEDQPPVGKMIQGQGMHGRGGGCAGRDLHDGGAQLDGLGMGAHPGQRRQGIGAIGLGGEKPVIAQGLRPLGQIDQPLWRLCAPIAGHQTQFQRHFGLQFSNQFEIFRGAGPPPPPPGRPRNYDQWVAGWGRGGPGQSH